MKAQGLLLSTIFLLSSFAASGCTATPEGFHRASTRLGCRTLKKCDEDAWKDADFDNIGDCVDESLKVVSESDFADLCENYDKKEARKCLRSGRKYRRSCDESDVDEDACGKVCGSISFPTELNPADEGRAVAEAKFAAGEITEEDLEDEIEDEIEGDDLDPDLEVEEDEDALLQAEIDAILADED